MAFLRLCHLIFPDSVTTTRAIRSHTGRPLVCILGWGGAKPRQLKRLADFYSQEKNVQVLSFIMPLWVPGCVRDCLLGDLKYQISQQSKTKLFLHSYSNNGAWVYAELVQMGLKFDKVIIDAAPWFVYKKPSIIEEANLLSKVVTSILMKGKIEHPMVSPFIRCILVLVGTMSRFLESVQKVTFTQSQPFVKDLIGLSNFLRNDSPKTPSLFLFTREDALIPPRYITDFIQTLKKRDVPVFDHEFPSGPHTSAFFLHTPKYKALVSEFFDI